MKELKPLVLIFGSPKFADNIFQQNLLLRAMSQTTNLDELKKIAGFHSKAQVLRTLDKLAIRQEFHDALVRNGMDIDNIVSGLKELCVDSSSDKVRMSGYQTLLKSLGLDKYDIQDTKDSGWEELLLKIIDKEDNGADSVIPGEYHVEPPQAPPREVEKRRKDLDIEKSIYE
jgi:hypothetical protein